MTHNIEFDAEAGLLEFQVSETEDGMITLEWDHDHPTAIEMGINDWSEAQWIEFLTENATAFLHSEEGEISD